MVIELTVYHKSRHGKNKYALVLARTYEQENSPRIPEMKVTQHLKKEHQILVNTELYT